MFPIQNESGKTIAFAGRALSAGDEPKYMNSPETPIYKKSYVLFNLHRAKDAIRKEERSVLVEGYMDVIGVYAAGVREVVASCGTALTSHQVQALKRHSGRIVVNFDPDAAGGAAAERSIQILLDEGLHIRVLELGGGLDPDEYCKQHGPAGYRAALDGSKNYFYWLADRARARFDMRTAEGRVAGFQFLLPAIQRLTDKIERVAVAGDVAGYLGVDAGLVLEQFRKAAGDRKEQSLRAPVEPVRFAEKALLHLLLDQPATRSEYIPRMRKLEAVSRFSACRIFQAIFALHDAGAPFGFAELDARLEDPDRDRLAKILLAGETEGEVFSLSQGEECLRSLEVQERDQQISALRSRIREAERAGDLNQALHIAEELDRQRRKD
jgi:DNA primase